MGVNVCLTLYIKHYKKCKQNRNLEHSFKSFFDVKLELKNLMLKDKVTMKNHSAGDGGD